MAKRIKSNVLRSPMSIGDRSTRSARLRNHVGSSLRPLDRQPDSISGSSYTRRGRAPDFVAATKNDKVIVASSVNPARLRLVLIYNPSPPWPSFPIFLVDSDGSYQYVIDPKELDTNIRLTEVSPKTLCQFFVSLVQHGAFKETTRNKERFVAARKLKIGRGRRRS